MDFLVEFIRSSFEYIFLAVVALGGIFIGAKLSKGKKKKEK